MKVTDVTRRALAWKRQKRDLVSNGYIHLSDPYWPIDRGGERDKVIIDVQIAADGKTLYIKTGLPA